MKPNFSTPPSPPNKLKPFTTLAVRASASLKAHLRQRQVLHLLLLQLLAPHLPRHRHRRLRQLLQQHLGQDMGPLRLLHRDQQLHLRQLRRRFTHRAQLRVLLLLQPLVPRPRPHRHLHLLRQPLLRLRLRPLLLRQLLPLQHRHRHRHRHRELEEFMERLPLLRPAQLLHPNLHPNLRPHPALDLLLRDVDREVVELIGQRPTA